MALIGVSGEPAVANHVSDGSFVAASLDATLSALIAQLGGVSWLSGVPSRHNGNLDASNFVASGLGLRGYNFLEPNALYALESARHGMAHVAGYNQNVLNHLFSVPAYISDVNLIVRPSAGTTDTPWTFSTYINGKPYGACTILASNGKTGTGVLDFGGAYVAVGDLLVVAAVAADEGDTTTIEHVMCHINCRHGLVGANGTELT